MMNRRRRATLVGLCLLALAAPGLAAERLPQFPKDTPYPTVRGRLIEMGIEPVPVKPLPGELPPCRYANLFCQMYQEVLVCGTGNWMQYCQFLFRRRSDGQFLIVRTAGEDDYTVTPADFRGIVVLDISKARPYELDDVVISNDVRPDHRRSR